MAYSRKIGRMSQGASGRVCMFCDETSLSREHLWPDWVVRLLPTNSSYTARSSSMERGEATWQASSITHRARVVCESCNGGWMSELENATKETLKPLILHSLGRRTLTVYDQCALAAWWTLRAMIFDSQTDPERRYYLRAQRLAFKASPDMAPPPNTYIWMAARVSNQVRASFLPVRQVHDDGIRGAQVITMVLHKIAVQIGTHRGPGRMENVDPNTLLPPEWSQVCPQIWPSRGVEIAWPPPKQLDDRGVQALRYRFGRGLEPGETRG